MALSLGGMNMASIIKKLNKQTGVTYVYESESYWDKEKKQPRSKRKLIGRIDEETGEIVPTGGRGKTKKREAADVSQMVSDDEALKALCLEQEKLLQQKDEELSALKKQVMELTLTVNGYKRRLSKIEELSRL